MEVKNQFIPSTISTLNTCDFSQPKKIHSLLLGWTFDWVRKGFVHVMWFETSSFQKGLSWSTSFSSPLFHLSIELELRHLKKMSEIQSKASLIPEISLAKNGQTVSLWYILRLFSLLMGIPSTPTRRKGLLSNFPPISPTPAKTPFPPHPLPPKTGKRGIAHLIGHSLRLGPLVADGPGCHMLDSSCPSAEALLLF